jgi:diguanylate cyclase (GGDEF)-like protein
VLDQLYIEQPEDFSLLFDLADAFFQNQAEDRGVALLDEIKQRMFSARRSSEFTAQLDRLADVHRSSIPLAEFGGRVYDELNRESKYFTYLTRLFDLYSASRNFQGACNSLDRIVDIDPYDADNNSRLAQLEGNVDPAYLRGVAARLGKTVSAQSNFTVGLGEESRAARSGTAAPLTEEARARQQLEDLIVQAEIFLQYSLHQKAVERLQSIAQQFPGEEDKNARLRNLYDLANWHPPSTRKQEVPIVEAKSAATIAQTGSFSGETLRDLGKVSEITRLIHRQSTPKAVMTAAVGEIGKYLRVTRCLAVFGTGAQETLLSAEYTVSGLPPVTDEEIRRLAAALSEMPPDASGVCALDAVREPFLRQLTLDSVTAAPLNDRESQSTAGMLIIGDAAPRKWKPNEGYFLQAVGDQVLIGVNHTRLRSLMRNLAVADEKTGLLSRGSYQDCLLSESNRMKSQNTPLSLLLLSIDRGPELLRQYGEQQIEKHMEQMARALQPSVRQTDIPIKYTSWALAFVLTDTRLVAALQIADKLRKAAAAVAPPWNGGGLTVSASVVEAVSRPDFESEDIVTDLMNRAEFGLEEARKKGGDSIQSL